MKHASLLFRFIIIIGFSILVSCKVEEQFVNSAPVIDNQQFSIKDECLNGTIVDTVIATDIDKKQTLSFSILSGNLNSAFVIDPQTGVIKVNNSPVIKFEKNPLFELAVMVSDNDINALSTSAKITINIIDAFKNGKPVIYNQSFSIDENKPKETIVGTVIATDFDINQKLKYSIIAGNPNNAFKIDSLTGVIKVNNSSVLDYEKTPIFELYIEVSDNYVDKLSASAKITINLNDIFENRSPLINNQNFSIEENKPNGTYVGTVLAMDYDVNQTLSFSIISGNTNNAFGIEASTGKLYVNNINALNYEQIQSFDLKVKVADSYTLSLSDTAIITVNIQNIEEVNIPLNALVAYYPFNGNANDESGNNHNATIYGATLTTDRHHKANSAYEFDGVNDFINTFSTFDYNYRTISLWVNSYEIHNTGLKANFVIAQDSPINSYGALIVFFADGLLGMNAGGTIAANQYSDNKTLENSWHHLVLVRNGTQTLYYVNGDLVLTGVAGSLTCASSPNSQLIIGAGRSTTQQFFSGKIDDIAIYNRVLSASEINTIYGAK